MADLAALALEHFGFDKQLMVLGEEAGELAAACCRISTGKGTLLDVLEEAIGVELVLRSIRHLLGSPEEWAEVGAEQAEKLRTKLRRSDP